MCVHACVHACVHVCVCALEYMSMCVQRCLPITHTHIQTTTFETMSDNLDYRKKAKGSDTHNIRVWGKQGLAGSPTPNTEHSKHHSIHNGSYQQLATNWLNHPAITNKLPVSCQLHVYHFNYMRIVSTTSISCQLHVYCVNYMCIMSIVCVIHRRMIRSNHWL